MKTVIMFVLLFVVLSCAKESSPEGRSKIRDNHLQEQLDSLKSQNAALRKEIDWIKNELSVMNP